MSCWSCGSTFHYTYDHGAFVRGQLGPEQATRVLRDAPIPTHSCTDRVDQDRYCQDCRTKVGKVVDRFLTDQEVENFRKRLGEPELFKPMRMSEALAIIHYVTAK